MRRPMVCLAAVFAALCLLAAPKAEAQVMVSSVRAGPGPAGVGTGISRAALERYAELLGLDEGQSQAAEALREVYEQENREADRKLEQRMEELRQEMEDSGDFSVMMEQMPAIMKEYGAGAAKREATFLADVQTLLDEEQAARWPKLERLRRREQMLRFGFVSGDSVDLVEIVRVLELADEARANLADPLEIYETEMDRVLQERMRAMEEAQKEMEGEGGAFNFDMAKIQEQMKQMREHGIKVRDLNRRHADLLAAALPEEARPEFAERLQTATYPQVYRRSHAERAIEAALGFADLSPEQKTALEDLSARYERDLDQANGRWAREIQKAEDEGVVGGMAGAGMRMVFGGPEEPESLAEARKGRRELDRRTLDAAKEVLTEEQIARLPDRSEEGDEVEGMVIPAGGMRIRTAR